MQPLIDGKDTKKCKICREVKFISEYHPNKQCSKGVVGTCRDCKKIYTGKWYSDNRRRRQDYANEKNKSRKKEIVKHFGNKCHDCEQSYPQYVYQFHHLDPTKKDVNPSYAMTQRPSKMWEELDKCIMLCANCHMIRHHGIESEVVNATTH
jgi:hypothetical protein